MPPDQSTSLTDRSGHQQRLSPFGPLPRPLVRQGDDLLDDIEGEAGEPRASRLPAAWRLAGL